MPSYTVYFTTVGSTHVKVEASDPEEALDKAYDEVYVYLCHQCAHELDLGGEWEADSVYDNETNEEVWRENA